MDYLLTQAEGSDDILNHNDCEARREKKKKVFDYTVFQTIR